MIVVRTSDGEIFEVEEAVALQSQIIKHMIEDDCADGAIPLPNVTSKIMSKVIQYCECHVNKPDMKMKMFDKEFADLDMETLYHLLMAANYLEIKDLLDLLCARVADMIKGKTPEQIREAFNIKNDFTKEEEDELRRKSSWAFE